jgi:mRNA-degrading endonuclease RelE of RelBE toxin-antitoxin system
VKIEWSPAARASARRYMGDQKAMRAIDEAIAKLAEDPHPAHTFHRGDYHRMRVGPYRVIYVVDQDVITVERVDRASG